MLFNATKMGLLRLLIDDPLQFLIVAPVLLYSIILHEFAHGWVADKMGDPTARWLGRLSLNPIKHIDPIGTLMLFVFGFGWAKPVPVNYNNLHDFKKGLVFVSAAGITANIILAFIALCIGHYVDPMFITMVGKVVTTTAQINIMLASFNLIPIPPLDGSKILMAFATPRFRYGIERLEPYGMFIILGLLYLGFLNPVIKFFWRLILGVIGILLP